MGHDLSATAARGPDSAGAAAVFRKSGNGVSLRLRARERKTVLLPGSLLLALAIAVGEAAAHGGRVPLANWGPFPAATAVCQRALLGATLRCARDTWEVRRRCEAAKADGRACDAAATDARIVRVRRAALNRIDERCSERQLGELGFLGQFDMSSDVIGACRGWEDLMESATYATVAPSGAGCMRTADRLLTRAATHLFERWEDALRAIATRPMTAGEKEAQVARVEARQAAVAADVLPPLAAACGASEAQRLLRVVELAVCPPAAISVQDRVVCPPPDCSNGLNESPVCAD